MGLLGLLGAAFGDEHGVLEGFARGMNPSPTPRKRRAGVRTWERKLNAAATRKAVGVNPGARKAVQGQLAAAAGALKSGSSLPASQASAIAAATGLLKPNLPTAATGALHPAVAPILPSLPAPVQQVVASVPPVAQPAAVAAAAAAAARGATPTQAANAAASHPKVVAHSGLLTPAARPSASRLLTGRLSLAGFGDDLTTGGPFATGGAGGSDTGALPSGGATSSVATIDPNTDPNQGNAPAGSVDQFGVPSGYTPQNQAWVSADLWAGNPLAWTVNGQPLKFRLAFPMIDLSSILSDPAFDEFGKVDPYNRLFDNAAGHPQPDQWASVYNLDDLRWDQHPPTNTMLTAICVPPGLVAPAGAGNRMQGTAPAYDSPFFDSHAGKPGLETIQEVHTQPNPPTIDVATLEPWTPMPADYWRLDLASGTPEYFYPFLPVPIDLLSYYVAGIVPDQAQGQSAQQFWQPLLPFLNPYISATGGTLPYGGRDGGWQEGQHSGRGGITVYESSDLASAAAQKRGGIVATTGLLPGALQSPGSSSSSSSTSSPTAGYPIDPSSGMPYDPSSGALLNPTTGQPTGQYIGGSSSTIAPPAASSPTAGYPIDPSSGMPYDPSSGALLDPTTGAPTGFYIGDLNQAPTTDNGVNPYDAGGGYSAGGNYADGGVGIVPQPLYSPDATDFSTVPFDPSAQDFGPQSPTDAGGGPAPVDFTDTPPAPGMASTTPALYFDPSSGLYYDPSTGLAVDPSTGDVYDLQSGDVVGNIGPVSSDGSSVISAQPDTRAAGGDFATAGDNGGSAFYDDGSGF